MQKNNQKNVEIIEENSAIDFSSFQTLAILNLFLSINSSNLSTLELAEAFEREEVLKREEIEQREASNVRVRRTEREYVKYFTNARFLTQSYLIESAIAHDVQSVEDIAQLCECSRERVLQHISHLKREESDKIKLSLNKSKTLVSAQVLSLRKI